MDGPIALYITSASANEAGPCKKCIISSKHERCKQMRFCETYPTQPALCVVLCFKQFCTDHEFLDPLQQCCPTRGPQQTDFKWPARVPKIFTICLLFLEIK